jgi:hypothetical protein
LNDCCIFLCNISADVLQMCDESEYSIRSVIHVCFS